MRDVVAQGPSKARRMYNVDGDFISGAMLMLRETAHKTGAFPGQGNCNGEFGKKEMKTKHKKLRGAVRVAGVSSSWKFVKSNVLREYDVDLLDLRSTFFTNFHN